MKDIKNIFTSKRLLVMLFVFLFWLGCYLLFNFITSLRETYNPGFAFETSIPFIPEFVFIYLMVFLVIFVPFFFVRKMDFYFAMAKSYIFVIIVSCIIYLLYPAELPRYEYAMDTFSGWALNLLYAFDMPHNLLPSMHVSMAFLSSFIVNSYSKKYGIFLIALSVLISISTLFIKQHYILDVVTGFILALIGYCVFVYLKKNKFLFPK
ncbi:phosphatase PAP2 family protein [Candidatus Woesearchaeota archaeon]|nr:phosphatase PAP2 family protein [Candidatus Woesearchaeota archaeon]